MGRKWTEKEKHMFAEYDKLNTIQIKLKLNKKSDADIIDKLRNVDNKQGYIKTLVRKDINNEK